MPSVSERQRRMMGADLARARAILSAFFALFITVTAQAQVQPSGNFTVGHVFRIQNPAGTAVVDGGGAAGSSHNGVGYLTEIGITNTGTPLCINDALISGAYHQLCFGANALGSGLISYNAYNGAAEFPLIFNVNGVNIPTVPGSISGLPEAIDNTALGALASTFSTAVLRLDYSVGLGAPPLVFRSSNSPCSINGGNGDGGSQVKSSDNKCWLAAFPASGLSPQQFGAKGDGTTDDTTAVQNAINAASVANEGPGLVLLENHIYGINPTITLPGNMRLVGAIGPGYLSSTSGFRSLTTNANNLIAVTNDGNVIENLVILADHNGVGNSSGVILFNNNAHNTIVSGVSIINACTAIAENGNSNTYRDVRITSAVYDQTGCNLVTIGAITNHASTVDSRFVNTTINGQGSGSTGNAFSGIFMFDCGGCFFSNNDILFTGNGTAISPGVNQNVEWGFWSNTVVADSTTGNGLDINTGAASGTVRGLMFNGAWIAGSGNYLAIGSFTAGSNVFIHNDGGGTIQGVHFVGSRFFTSSHDAINISSASDVTIDSSNLCAVGNLAGSWNGVTINTGVTHVSVRDNNLESNCDDVPGPAHSAAGVGLQGATNNNIIITGNTLEPTSGVGIATASAFADGAANTIGNNVGVSDHIGDLVAASTIDLPNALDIYQMTGATGVSSITSGWAGRRVMIRTVSAVTFNTGGTANETMCSTLTSSAGETYAFTYMPGIACWAHTP